MDSDTILCQHAWQAQKSHQKLKYFSVGTKCKLRRSLSSICNYKMIKKPLGQTYSMLFAECCTSMNNRYNIWWDCTILHVVKTKKMRPKSKDLHSEDMKDK